MVKSTDNIERAVKDGVDEITDIKEQRKALNDRMQKVLSTLEADHGLHRDAVKMAIRVMEMDPVQRQHFDVAYGVVRKLAGHALQPDLFEIDALAETAKAASEAKGRSKADAEA